MWCAATDLAAEGGFRLEALGGPTQHIWPREVRLWEEVPDASWESVPGLMALYPLCNHGQKLPDPQAVERVSFQRKKIDRLSTLTKSLFLSLQCCIDQP